MDQTTTTARSSRKVIAVAVFFAFISAAMLLGAVAQAAPLCNGAFSGVTPANPISKVADKSTAYVGQTVTFTIGWTSTGAHNASVEDCYRVDDGSNTALNALVTGFNAVHTIANEGTAGSPQTNTFTITIPAGLSGHTIVDRAKLTKGSVESRSDNVSVTIVDPPVEIIPTPTITPTVTPTPTIIPTVTPTPTITPTEVITPTPTITPTVTPTPTITPTEVITPTPTPSDPAGNVTPPPSPTSGGTTTSVVKVKGLVLRRNVKGLGTLAHTGVDVRVILLAGFAMLGLGMWLTRATKEHELVTEGTAARRWSQRELQDHAGTNHRRGGAARSPPGTG